MKGKRLKFFVLLMALFMVFPVLTLSVNAQDSESGTVVLDKGISSQGIYSNTVKITNNQRKTIDIGSTYQLNATSKNGGTLYWRAFTPCANWITPEGLYLAKHTINDNACVTSDDYSSDDQSIDVSFSPDLTFDNFDYTDNSNSVALTIGETFSNPVSSTSGTQDSIRYSSYDPTVASVDSKGTVTALSEGMTRIYARDRSGAEIGYGVYVRKDESISSWLSTQSVTVSNGTLSSVFLIMIHNDGTNEVTSITSSDSDIVHAYSYWTQLGPGCDYSEIVIHAKKTGTATITCESRDGLTHTLTVNVIDSDPSLTLNQSKITLDIGKTSTLKATNTEAPIRCFISSDETVAQVDDCGNVCAISPGTATITAYLDNGVTASCEVTVNYAPATSVTLSETSTTVDRGDEKTLTATVNPFGARQEVTWSSSDPSTATVTDGVVKGIKEGKTTITVKDTAGHTVSCQVTVKIPQAESVSIKADSNTVNVGSTIHFSASVFPVGADQSVTWRSSDTRIAEITSDGTVIGKKKGISVITATSSEGKVLSNGVTITVDRVIGEVQPIYRLYLPLTGEHLYTPDYNEYQTLYKKYGWGQEGIAWYSPVLTGDPVYRLYQPNLKNHLYTTDKNEVKVLTTKAGWVTDNNGEALFYSDGDVDILRVYNCGLNGMHHLSTSTQECNTLVENYGWMHEGVKLYALLVGEPYDKTDYYNK